MVWTCLDQTITLWRAELGPTGGPAQVMASAIDPHAARWAGGWAQKVMVWTNITFWAAAQASLRVESRNHHLLGRPPASLPVHHSFDPYPQVMFLGQALAFTRSVAVSRVAISVAGGLQGKLQGRELRA